jgi:hypothetical protein
MPVSVSEAAAEFRQRWLAALPQAERLDEDARSVAIAFLLAGPNNPEAEFFCDAAAIGRRIGQTPHQVRRGAECLAAAGLLRIGQPIDGCLRFRLALPAPDMKGADYG